MINTNVSYRGKKILVREDVRYPLKYVRVEFSEKHFVQLLASIDVHERLRLKKFIWRGGIPIKQRVKGSSRTIDISNYYSYIKKTFRRGVKSMHIGFGFYQPNKELVVIYPEGFLPNVLKLKKLQRRTRLTQLVSNVIVEELAHACQPVPKSKEHYYQMFTDKYKPHLLQLALFYLGLLLILGQTAMSIIGRKISAPIWVLGVICLLKVVYDMTLSEKKVLYPHLYSTKDYQQDYFEIFAKKLALEPKLLKLAEKAFKVK
ncbi:hypothetical protein KBD69_03435 [Candidatus Woesebacteria bacterium]|nr:hypothetical protein [Candidatus Woesebacteria bacterium]